MVETDALDTLTNQAASGERRHDEPTNGVSQPLGSGFDSARLAGAEIAVYSSFADCAAFWERATRDCACYVFQTFDWQATWQATVGHAQRVRPLLVHVTDASGCSLMILPLGIYKRYRLKMLQFLGGRMTDYHAPIIDRRFANELTTADMAKLWAAILRHLPRADVIWLWSMPATVDGVRNPMTALPSVRFSENAHAAVLPSSFDAFTATRSKDLFKDTRRRQRKLSQRGRVDIRPARDGVEALEFVRLMARQKSRRWRETGAYDNFSLGEYLAFYETITTKWFDSGRAHVSGLRVANDIVATDWGVIFKNRFYSLMAGYEGGEWAQYSLGRILLENVVRWCIDEPQIDVFDLTVGDERYKRQWADQTMAVYEYRRARSVKGCLFVAALRLRTAIRKNPRIVAVGRHLKRVTHCGRRANSNFAPT